MSCSISGVPRITLIKNRVSQLKGFIFDMRPKATKRPNGMLSTSVRKKMAPVVKKPSPSWVKIACILTSADSKTGIGME